MNELYHVVGNEVGRALLFDLVQSLGKGSGGSLIIIEVIDINDDEKWLSPQTAERTDGKIALYNLVDQDSVAVEKEVSNLNRTYGFLVNIRSKNIIEDPVRLEQMDTPEQYVTLS